MTILAVAGSNLSGNQHIRNLQSVSIDLQPFIDSGLLIFLSVRASIGSGETHLRTIRSTAQHHDASCIVIDPLTALTSFVTRRTTSGITERLIDWAKVEGRTLVCTGLLDNPEELLDAPLFHISTISDTWIHLNNAVHGQERRRDLSILKSRGTGHSENICNFVLSDAGLALTENLANGAGR